MCCWAVESVAEACVAFVGIVVVAVVATWFAVVAALAMAVVIVVGWVVVEMQLVVVVVVFEQVSRASHCAELAVLKLLQPLAV